MMHKPERPSPRSLCVRVGTSCIGILSVYMVLYTIPRWNELVSDNIKARGGNLHVIFFSFVWLVISQLAHALTYFMLLGSVGAISTGILQSLRAILVFAFSSLLFCEVQESQCYTLKRGLATLVVVAGVIYYSLSKGRNSPNFVALPMQTPKKLIGNTIKT